MSRAAITHAGCYRRKLRTCNLGEELSETTAASRTGLTELAAMSSAINLKAWVYAEI